MRERDYHGLPWTTLVQSSMLRYADSKHRQVLQYMYAYVHDHERKAYVHAHERVLPITEGSEPERVPTKSALRGISGIGTLICVDKTFDAQTTPLTLDACMLTLDAYACDVHSRRRSPQAGRMHPRDAGRLKLDACILPTPVASS